MQQELEAMRKALVIRNYATKTVNTYVSVLKRFLEQLDKPIKHRRLCLDNLPQMRLAHESRAIHRITERSKPPQRSTRVSTGDPRPRPQ